MGAVRAPKQPDYWDIVVKVRRCTKEELVAVLEAIEEQLIMDVRATSVHTS